MFRIESRPLMRIVVCLLILGMVLAILQGCGLDRPRAEVRGVSATDRSQEGLRLEIVVDLENTGDEILPLVASQYTVTIDQVGSYESSDRLIRTLPAANELETGRGDATATPRQPGRQVIQLPVALPWDGRDVAGLTYRVEGTVSYRPPGEIRALLSEAKLPLPLVYFNGSGELQ